MIHNFIESRGWTALEKRAQRFGKRLNGAQSERVKKGASLQREARICHEAMLVFER
jgi:hypothetical protein